MTECERIAGSAAGLAALAKNDPERLAAEAHARGCVACAAALHEGAAVVTLLGSARPPALPSPQALQRASSQILAELAAGRGAVTGKARGQVRFSLGLLAAGVSAWAIPLALSRKRLPFGPEWALSGAVAALAAVAAALSFTSGGLVLGMVPLASALFALLDGAGGGLHAAVGVKCVIAELISSAIPLAAAVTLLRRGVSGGAKEIAAAGCAGALAGQALLHLTCPVSTATPHLFVFHTGGVLVAALLGGLLGRVAAPRRT